MNMYTSKFSLLLDAPENRQIDDPSIEDIGRLLRHHPVDMFNVRFRKFWKTALIGWHSSFM